MYDPNQKNVTQPKMHNITTIIHNYTRLIHNKDFKYRNMANEIRNKDSEESIFYE